MVFFLKFLVFIVIETLLTNDWRIVSKYIAAHYTDIVFDGALADGIFVWPRVGFQDCFNALFSKVLPGPVSETILQTFVNSMVTKKGVEVCRRIVIQVT